MRKALCNRGRSGFHNPSGRCLSLVIYFVLLVGSWRLFGDQFEFFEKRIRPVLVERCYPCHSLGAEKLKGDLLLDSQEGMLKGGGSGKPAIVAGNAEASQLVEAIRYINDDLQMPPPKKGKLSPDQIADFVTWINSGAPDPRAKQAGNLPSLAERYQAAKNHWAFQPVGNPPVPVVAKETGPKTAIDNFIIAQLAAHGLQLSAPADKRALIRRASYDLLGLPPTAEQVNAFIADRSPEACAKLVEHLLASPRYGERWGRYWLDVARFADTKGYVYEGREETKFIHSAAYRDWVIKAFNEDMPYDQFLKLQIAADQLEGAELGSLAAMGYLTLGRRFLGVVHDIIDDRIDVLMRGTQALTVGCARCHDHKFDPVPTADYYSLYGVFSGCTERAVPLAPAMASANAYLEFDKELKTREDNFRSVFNSKRDEQSKRLRAKATEYLLAVLEVEKYPSEEFYSFVQADDLNPIVVRGWHGYLLSTGKTFHPIWAPWHACAALSAGEFSARAASAISSCANGTNKLNPILEKALGEKVPGSMREVAEIYGGLLGNIDKKWTEAADKSKALSKDEEALRQVLYAAESPAVVPAGAIVDLEWYFDEPTRVELGKLSSRIEQWILQAPGAPPYAMILEDRALQKNARVFKRGNPVNKGEEVPRQFLEILSGAGRKPFEKGSGRLELAQAIASKQNPLTARVLVNRDWLHHFGAGLVRTPSDFGTRAEPPSHPELLDWLANHFMENGWSIKGLHRLIMCSAAYQQASGEEKQPASETVSRSSAPAARFKPGSSPHPHQALPLEIDPENKLLWRMNRQRLDFESVRDSLLSVSGQLETNIGGKAEMLFKAPFSKRRSVYGFIDRQFLPGPFRLFDFPNPDMHNPQRSETTVPQQALFFLNSPFVIDQARALAVRVGAAGESEPRERKAVSETIRRLYRIAFQREPTAAELKGGLQFIASAGLEQHDKTPPPQSLWSYGYGEYDETARQLKGFEPLPHFTGEAWQGGKNWPDEKLGWAQLTASGGHAGNDRQHAVVRRWTSPVAGSVSVEGMVKHEHKEGHGIRAYLVSSRKGLLGSWVLHNAAAEAGAESIEVKPGDTIDFVVSIDQSLNNNDFAWSPVIRMSGPEAARDANGYARQWQAGKEFGGPPGELPKPLNAWEQYAQVLLLSNEFVFVD
jgi:hypothetical protein